MNQNKTRFSLDIVIASEYCEEKQKYHMTQSAIFR